jgi:voltage-gated potassium channel
VRRGLLRAAVSAVVTVTLYYVLPLGERADARVVFELMFAIVMLGALVAWQLRAIVRASYPGIRAIQALATATPLFLLLFSATYYILSAQDPSSFGEPLTRSDALYFTITIFSTVGFGDITPDTGVAPLVTTSQMLLDLAILGSGHPGGARSRPAGALVGKLSAKAPIVPTGTGSAFPPEGPGSRHPTEGTSPRGGAPPGSMKWS